jgi:hypothetical protein
MPVTRDLLAYYRGLEIHNDPLHCESVAVAVNCEYPESDHAARSRLRVRSMSPFNVLSSQVIGAGTAWMTIESSDVICSRLDPPVLQHQPGCGTKRLLVFDARGWQQQCFELDRRFDD